MDDAGLWNLFWSTGLPEAYLAIRGRAYEREAEECPQALTAFRAQPPERKRS